MKKVALFVVIGIVVYFLYIKYRVQTQSAASGQGGNTLPPSPLPGGIDQSGFGGQQGSSGGGFGGGGGSAFLLPPSGGTVTTQTSTPYAPTTSVVVQSPTPAPVYTYGGSMTTYTPSYQPSPIRNVSKVAMYSVE